jgi:hypothetical protein
MEDKCLLKNRRRKIGGYNSVLTAHENYTQLPKGSASTPFFTSYACISFSDVSSSEGTGAMKPS